MDKFILFMIGMLIGAIGFNYMADTVLTVKQIQLIQVKIDIENVQKSYIEQKAKG